LAVTQSRLSLYLAAEQVMLLAELVDEQLADSIRDVMDPIWDALSDDERRVLREREVHFPRSLQGLQIPVSDDLYCPPPPAPEPRPIPEGPIEDWRNAA
jgi:hypothetical protein